MPMKLWWQSGSSAAADGILLVLVAGDDATTRTTIRSWLEEDGYRVFAMPARDLAETVARGWLPGPPDCHPRLVVVDDRSPWADRMRMLRDVRAISDVPVVVMASADPALGIDRLLTELGEVTVLERPPRKSALLEVVDLAVSTSAPPSPPAAA